MSHLPEALALLRTFEGHSREVWSVAFSADGTRVLSGSKDQTMRLWNAATSKLLRTFEGYVREVAVSPDGRRVFSVGNNVQAWDAETGVLLTTLGRHLRWANKVMWFPDGARLLASTGDIWSAATGEFLLNFSEALRYEAFSPDGARLISAGTGGKNTVMLSDAATGRLLRIIEGHSNSVRTVAFSRDGARVLSGSSDKTLKLWDAATGRLLRTFTGHTGEADYEGVVSVALSPDGTRVLSGGTDKTMRLWDAATGQLLRTTPHSGNVSSVVFSRDGTQALSGSWDNMARLWDIATGRQLRTFAGHSHFVNSAVFSPDESKVLTSSYDKTIKLWDVVTGRLLRTFSGHSEFVQSAVFSADGARIVSVSQDLTIRIWNAQTGEQLVSFIRSQDGEWLTITPEGFFFSTKKGADLLSVVRGLEVYSIDQIFQSLFSPDLVRETLAGDPVGEVRAAAKVINLEKVVDSGPAPVVAITSHPASSESAVDLVTLQALIHDKGKGVGRIEWRVNGITASVAAAPADHTAEYVVTQRLALDAGDNTIEVVAYNAGNLLASLPAHTTIRLVAPAGTVKPKLHVLAIGINAYVDKGWQREGAADILAFPPLSLAVNDAKAFASAMKKASQEQYAEVEVTEALDGAATADNLKRIIEGIASRVAPRDTFVLFAAAHGTSLNGRFYLIPQDYDGGTNPEALEQRSIGQDLLQYWVANRITAKKAILLFDTCESGALVGGYTRSRTDVPASAAAIGRLHEATGRPVLTAAAEGKPAFEGYEGHGVFTWVLLDALKNGDRNGNGYIELSELVARVQDQVPKIAAKLNGRGRAAVAARGSTDDRQSARFGSHGEDFALVRRLQ